jgi:hypothetical protein
MNETLSHNHHYVPVWYQNRFLADGATAFRILDLNPEKIVLPNGGVKYRREILDKGPSAWFKTKDLYTVSLLGRPNDDIERMLFGPIDSQGRRAIDAWLHEKWAVVHETYWQMYEFMDALCLRTPKGLRYVRAVSRARGKFELMAWMQWMRRMHCVMWTEGVLEILSAKTSETKFVFTDHPVTFFNQYAFPGDPSIPAGFDPAQAWQGTQTLFPLDRDNLFVLTHLEWARSPGPAKAKKPRTNARYFDSPLVRYDKCGRGRCLTEDQVREVNFILKSRAHRYVAGRRDDDLFPEKHLKTTHWGKLGRFLLPPDQLWDWGGYTTAKMKDGSYFFQDEFGRRPKTKAEYEERLKDAERMERQFHEIMAKERARKQSQESS